MSNRAPHIVMLAAENDAIAGAKVGGIGDVVRDIPLALAEEGASVTVMMPAYGLFHTRADASKIGSVTVQFAGKNASLDVFEVLPDRHAGVRHLLLHHPLFSLCGTGAIYCNDGADNPFASDASKFALFSLAALQVLSDQLTDDIDALHLHDWHSAFAAILREYNPRYQWLQEKRCVFSIHNLALQGIRPFAGHSSSLENWYVDMPYDAQVLADPRWTDCVNPMASAIRLTDIVHTVSPTYASEIIKPNVPEQGFHGGEGLEADLLRRAEQGTLKGIINGIEYTSMATGNTPSWPSLIKQISTVVLEGMAKDPQLKTADYIAHQRCMNWQQQQRPRHLLTSVGRLTAQKMAILLQATEPGRCALDNMLELLKERGLFILLGSGDPEFEAQCVEIAARHENLLFLNRYSQAIADALFANGELFIMPSSFEPCGISQMLAMQQGQPCLVHSVGGLRDTVVDNVDGFQFHGDSRAAQSAHMLERLENILTMREQQPGEFKRIADTAKSRRFTWQQSARLYIEQLYS